MLREVADPLETLLRPGALRVLFQPIVDLRPRRKMLHGVECLARGPKDTPYADARVLFDEVRARGEEIGVDRACISEALRAAARLPKVPSFSINVHSRTLGEDGDFADFFIESLCLWGIDPKRVTLDVLRPASFTRPLVETVQLLRSVGVAIAIDDVGLGQTDYEGLFACRPDYLKIDRAWLRLNPPDPLRDTMVESMVRLARGLGAQPVAEGIESLEELDAASAKGIQLIQGHFFSEPMTAKELIETDMIGERGLCG